MYIKMHAVCIKSGTMDVFLDVQYCMKSQQVQNRRKKSMSEDFSEPTANKQGECSGLYQKIKIQLKEFINSQNVIQLQNNESVKSNEEKTQIFDDDQMNKDIKLMTDEMKKLCLQKLIETHPEIPIQEIIKHLCQNFESLSLIEKNSSTINETLKKLQNSQNESNLIQQKNEKRNELIQRKQTQHENVRNENTPRCLILHGYNFYENELFRPSNWEYKEYLNFRNNKIAVAQFFLLYGNNWLEYKNSPERNLSFFDYSNYLSFIGFSVMKDMEVYILVNTNKYLKKLKQNEKERLRHALRRISHVLTQTQHFQIYKKFIQIHCGFIKQQQANLNPERVVEVYETILSKIKRRSIRLKDKKTVTIYFYNFHNADFGYIFTFKEMADIQKYAISYLDLNEIQRRMTYKYSWDEEFSIEPTQRRNAILNQLTTQIQARIKSIIVFSDFQEQEKLRAKMEIKDIEQMFSKNRKNNSQLKNLLTKIFQFDGQISSRKANAIIKQVNEHKLKYVEVISQNVKKSEAQWKKNEFNKIRKKTLSKLENNFFMSDVYRRNDCYKFSKQKQKGQIIQNPDGYEHSEIQMQKQKIIKQKQLDKYQQKINQQINNKTFNTSEIINIQEKYKDQSIKKGNLIQNQLMSKYASKCQQNIKPSQITVSKSNKRFLSFKRQEFKTNQNYLKYVKYMQKQMKCKYDPSQECLIPDVEKYQNNNISTHLYDPNEGQARYFSNQVNKDLINPLTSQKYSNESSEKHFIKRQDPNYYQKQKYQQQTQFQDDSNYEQKLNDEYENIIQQ